MELRGKVAIVTGGGTGLGRVTSLMLAAAGTPLSIVYSRSEREANETAAEGAARGVRAIPIRADVGNDPDVRAMVQRTRDELGQIDILVNDAAPGLLRTRWGAAFPEEQLRQFELGSTLKRATPIEHVATGVLMAITNDSITGQTIVIDRGLHFY